MFLPARRTVLLFTVAVLCAGIVPAGADEPGAKEPVADAARRARRPGQFFSILTFGYGGDDFPDDAALFETIVRRAREEGRFNAVMCSWSEERAAICRRHGMRIMVDLLNARHHVYKGPDEARALLERLRGDDVVMGHHLWSDEFGKQAEGRIRDLRACNAWDPTHPAYVATRKTGGLAVAAQADIFGWYDFHWKRSGWNRHFAALQVALPLARRHDSIFYSLLATDSGLPGRGNYNRSLWSVNQGVAFGMKGVVWFIGSRQMDVGSGAWTEIGRDINKVNAQVMPLAEELMRVGNPAAVYATPITRDANDREVAGGPRLLDELAGHGFPPDFWIQPAAGEFTMGVFALEGGRAAVYVANFNAYAGQEIVLALGRAVAVERFDRVRGEWVGLPVKEGRITFALGPAEGELLRLE